MLLYKQYGQDKLKTQSAFKISKICVSIFFAPIVTLNNNKTSLVLFISMFVNKHTCKHLVWPCEKNKTFWKSTFLSSLLMVHTIFIKNENGFFCFQIHITVFTPYIHNVCICRKGDCTHVESMMARFKSNIEYSMDLENVFQKKNRFQLLNSSIN